MPSVSYHCSPCSDLSIISVPNSWWSLSLGERVIWIFAYGQTLSSRLFIINTLSSYESLTDSCLHTSTMKLLWPRLRTTLWWFEQKYPHGLVCECLSPQAVVLLWVLLPLLPLISTLSYILSSSLTSTDTPNRTPPFQMDFHLKIQNQMHIWARTCSRSLPGPRLPHLI